MGVIAEALMMRLRALVYPRLLTNKDALRFRSLFYLSLKCFYIKNFFQHISLLAKMCVCMCVCGSVCVCACVRSACRISLSR